MKHDECVITKTPGCILKSLLPLTILGITLVLFIKLPISPTTDSTLEERFSGFIESPEGRKEK